MFLLKNKFGIYHFRFTDENGKGKQLSTGCSIKSDANKFVLNYFNSLKEKSVVKKYRISEFLSLFINNISMNKHYKDSMNLLKSFIEFTNDKYMNEVSIVDCESFKTFRQNSLSSRNKPYSIHSLNGELRNLRVLFNKALDYEIISKNPFKKIRYHRETEKEYNVISENEINILLNNIRNSDLLNIVKFGLYTGCRREEIMTLEWNDIDFQNKIIYIRNKDNFTTKSKKIRQIKMNNEKLYELMTNLYNSKNRFVFCKSNGYKYDGDYISKLFKKEVKRLGLSPKIHFHCIRHTHISMLLLKGANINLVSRYIGHSSISITQKYLHIKNEDCNNVNCCLSF